MTPSINAIGFTLGEKQSEMLNTKLKRIAYADDLIVDLLIKIKHDKDFSFEANLLTSEFLGFDFQYTFETGIGKIVMRSVEDLEPDRKYRLYVHDEDLFFFDQNQNVCEPFAIGGLKGVYHADE